MRRRGFALAAVLAALVVMAMVVAVGAQRALMGSRESVLALARAEMSGAAASAMAAVVAARAVAGRHPVIVAGVLLDSGTAVVGRARATWTLTGLVSPYAAVEIDARAPVFRGSARQTRRLIVGLRRDSVAGDQWVPVGGAGWGRMPAP